MDYSTISAMTITALSPIILKGLEKLAEKSVEEGFNERKVIWEKVKELFQSDDLTLLNLLQEAEEDTRKQNKLEGKLEGYLEMHPAIAKQIEDLLAKLPKTEASGITQFGNENIAVQNIHQSRININKKNL